MATAGERIGPFELVDPLAGGPRATLWRARRADGSDHRTREVVMRVADNPYDEGVLDALRREYETLLAMGDDRLPRAVGFYAGRGAVAVEHVPGVTLRDVLRAVAAGTIDLDLATAVDVIVEVAYALRHAHAIVREEGRIVHGALDADAVRLTAGGRVVVCGFGAPDRPPGTAPEQADGREADARTDQWLLGALALDVLRFAKEIAPHGPLDDANAVLAALQRASPPLHRAIVRMLARTPAQRHTHEERMLAELLAAARQIGGVSRRGEVAAKTLAFGRPAGEKPPSLAVEATGAPPTVELRPEGAGFDAGPEAPTEDARAEPAPSPGVPEEAPPPWRPPRIRSGPATLAGVPKPRQNTPPAPVAPEPEVAPRRLSAQRPTVSAVPDWLVVAFLAVLLGVGLLALWLRFGRG
ncbi:MAG: hypothetical protein ACOZNI_15610 [Myxococcota bacterium]